MKKIIVILVLSMSLHAGLSELGDNINKTIKLQGKLLDRANDMLDGKTPVIQFPKIQYMRKPQDIICQGNLKNALLYNSNLKKRIVHKDTELKKLKEENMKFKKLLTIHGIDYKHAEIKVDLNKKNKKMEMTITNK